MCTCNDKLKNERFSAKNGLRNSRNFRNHMKKTFRAKSASMRGREWVGYAVPKSKISLNPRFADDKIFFREL